MSLSLSLFHQPSSREISKCLDMRTLVRLSQTNCLWNLAENSSREENIRFNLSILFNELLLMYEYNDELVEILDFKFGLTIERIIRLKFCFGNF